ncbi:MAG: efflux transporter outer membrane subunit [Comamonadaceae bacterium]|nr:efflux transporter outer membrane subunit [Comamonadaceae bacterium]
MTKPATPRQARSPFARTLPALAVAAVMAGCSLTPTYERPAAPVAADWPAPAPAAPASATRSASELPWADFVGDASLRELIRLALVNNRDLRVAVLNIEQARATWQIRRADQFPTVNLGATGAVQPKTDGSGGTNSAYTAGLSFTSWELDLFGRVASLKDAALAQYLASEESRRAVQASLIAAVANTWLNLQTNDELLAITQSTLKTREDSLRLTRLRLDNGASSALDVRQAESLTAGALAALQQQQRLRAQDLNALTLLVGQPLPPALLVRPPPGAATQGRAGAIFTEVPAGLPSDLLTRRPDIRQAEQQLIAANANIGAARAAFFPRITLTAAYGTASTGLTNLFENGFWGGTLAGQVLQPIFDAGRNEANLASSQAGRDIAVAQYEKAIQTAFREVADALAGRATLGAQLAAQQAQVDAETDRFRLADLRYRNGVSSYLEVLDSQRSLFLLQQALAQVRLAYWQNQVTLYKVLGGGAAVPPA